MLKRLLKNYPQAASLETFGYKPKSKLSPEMKFKLLKSWVKGGSKSFFCNINNVSDEDYDIAVEDLINEAVATGEQVQINKSQSISEGTLWLYGHISNLINPTAAVYMLNLKRGSKDLYIDEFEVITGYKIEKRTPIKERTYFTKFSDEFIYHSPSTGRLMTDMEDCRYYDTETAAEKMKTAKIKAVLYCKDSYREFMLYDGDKNNPPGTYEFHFEHMADNENKEGMAS